MIWFICCHCMFRLTYRVYTPNCITRFETVELYRETKLSCLENIYVFIDNDCWLTVLRLNVNIACYSMESNIFGGIFHIDFSFFVILQETPVLQWYFSLFFKLSKIYTIISVQCQILLWINPRWLVWFLTTAVSKR